MCVCVRVFVENMLNVVVFFFFDLVRHAHCVRERFTLRASERNEDRQRRTESNWEDGGTRGERGQLK